MYISSFNTLSLVELRKLIRQPNFCKLIYKEHADVKEVPLTGTVTNFLSKENSAKNRYNCISCWDGSRVVLGSCEKAVEEDEGELLQSSMKFEETASSYIHANHVDGYKMTNKYICTQTPMENTWDDFLQMILEQQSHVIVSITDLIRDDVKSYAFWRMIQGSSVPLGRHVLKILEVKEELSFTRILLHITNVITKASREITNFWFTNLPENNIGREEFLDLRKAVNRAQSGLIEKAKSSGLLPGPIIVHCSTGVGWTGTFCAIDNALEQLEEEEKVSLPQTVLKIRSQRRCSVYLPEQYEFCYKLLEYVVQGEAENAEPILFHNGIECA